MEEASIGSQDLAGTGTTPNVPLPNSVKDAEKAVEGAFKDFRARVDAARKSYKDADKAYVRAVEQALRDRQEAAVPAKLGSIGIVQRVTLTETTVRTPRGEFPLSPEVSATAEQHGNKQVVQGWVFKSDNDRREIYLHLTGPDWADVVPFSMKNSWSQPRELHAFAAKVGVAARNSEQARREIMQRVDLAERRLIAVADERSALNRTAEAFVAATRDVRDLKPTTWDLEDILHGADKSDRKIRKTSGRLDEMRQQVRDLVTEADAAVAEVRQSNVLPLSRWIVTESQGMDSESPGDVAALAPVTGDATPEADEITEISGKGDPSAEATGRRGERSAEDTSDVIDQIRRLAELRDEGILTSEEFEAKKRELLGRL